MEEKHTPGPEEWLNDRYFGVIPTDTWTLPQVITELERYGSELLKQVYQQQLELQKLEAERSELRNKVIDKLNVLKNQAITKTKPYSAGCIDTIDIIEDFLNSLKNE